MTIRILLIDDDEVDRKSVKRALKKSGLRFELQEAHDAETAKSLFGESSFDCLLLDYQLPDGDGLTLAREFLNNSAGIGVAIVMLTGEGNEIIAVEAMKIGVHDYLPKSSIESDNLARAILNAVEKTAIRNKADDINKDFEYMALYDSLTGLGNRNLFNDRFNYQIATSRRNKERFSLLMMDLNKFKKINDNHGHNAGDAVLREVGNRLIALGRDADSFFRFGGDEFTALVTTDVDREGIEAMARRIIITLEAPIEFEYISLQISVSIGIVLFPEHSDDGEELLRLADTSMYEAKRNRLGFSIPPISNKQTSK